LKSNSSNYVSIEMLFQKENDDLIKSIIYFSKTLFSVEYNYEIYDKKLLTIIRCFEQWRAELQSMKTFINVLTDHKSLKYFMITKKLNKRQTKWAEFFAEFEFEIAYQSEKKNGKTNSLTCRSKNRSNEIDESDDRNKHMHQTIISAEKIDSQIVQKLNDTKKDLTLSLFDQVKTINQKDSTCITICQNDDSETIKKKKDTFSKT
jgi:hypothetical protein